MELVPVDVGRISRAWDEQHLDLLAAAGQIGDAPTGGFTPAVAGAAARFTTAWERHVTALADGAEIRADALRDVIADFLRTDGAVGSDLRALGAYLGEVR